MSAHDSTAPFFRPALLATARKAAGLTHAQLATTTRRSEWAVAAFETGALVPSLVTAYALARALDLDVVDLYGGVPLVDEPITTPGFTAATAGHLASLAGATA